MLVVCGALGILLQRDSGGQVDAASRPGDREDGAAAGEKMHWVRYWAAGGWQRAGRGGASGAVAIVRMETAPVKCVASGASICKPDALD